ncbi:8424_t:CDS:2, partial [Scutellospora calospora]
AQTYASHFEMDVYLVNFFLSGHKPPSVLDDILEEIIIINVEHNRAPPTKTLINGVEECLLNVGYNIIGEGL